MFSGLYGNLPQAKDDEKKTAGSWAGSGLLAPNKRPGGMAPPPSVLRAAAGGRGRGREGPPAVAPGRGGGRGPGPAAVSSGDAAVLVPAAGPAAAAAAGQDGAAAVIAAASGTMSLGQDLKEEYDPARPNDYEAVRKERERQRK
jgi:hypothetical protein